MGYPVWFEISVRDTERAKTFYGNVFGWESFTNNYEGGIEYTVFYKGDEQAAGMIKMTSEWGDMPSQWSVYFNVDKIEDSVKLAKEFGGTVLFEPKEIPGMKEKITLISDPCGVYFYIMGTISLKKD